MEPAGLRVIDTDTFMRSPTAVYLLSGNLSRVTDLEEIIEDSRHAKEFFSGIDKDPHDILIPKVVFQELTAIKDNPRNEGYRRNTARSALFNILEIVQEWTSDAVYDHFQDPSGSGFRIGEPLGGLDSIVLDNGARVFMADLSKKDFHDMYTSVVEADNDERIILTTLDFLKKHPEYQRVRIITNDGGLQGKAMLLYGIPSSPFRYSQVTDPLQLNKGYASVYVDYKTYTALERCENVDVIDNTLGISIDPDSLVPNQTIDFRKRKKKKVGGKSAHDSQYMIQVPGTTTLRKPMYFDAFYDFFTGFTPSQKERNRKAGREDVVELATELRDRGIIDGKEYQRQMKLVDRAQSSRNKKRKNLDQIFDELAKKNVGSTTAKGMTSIVKYPFYTSVLVPNGQQIPFIDHMANPDIELVSVNASGGFGKTLWALAVGLYGLYTNQYQKILYVASRIKADSGYGAVPGDKTQKIREDVVQCVEAMHILFGDLTLKDEKIDNYIDGLVRNGRLEMNVITDMSGRTIPNTYGILDETQFFTLDQLGLAIGRLGYKSKCVVLNAMEQKGSAMSKAFTDREAGISHLVEAMTGYNDYAHLTADWDQVSRGSLAVKAARLTDPGERLKRSLKRR